MSNSGGPLRPLTTVLIRVTDPERSAAFYERLLGVRFRQTNDGSYLATFAAAAASPISPIGVGPIFALALEKDDEPGITTAFSFVTESEDAIQARTARAGVEKPRLIGGSSGVAGKIKDPDGNPLEFLAFSEEARRLWTGGTEVSGDSEATAADAA